MVYSWAEEAVGSQAGLTALERFKVGQEGPGRPNPEEVWVLSRMECRLTEKLETGT